jgi:glycogen operon protein
VEENQGLLRFVRGLIGFTREIGVFHQRHYPGRVHGGSDLAATWHGVHLGCPDYGKHSHSIALELKSRSREEHVFIMLNAYWEPLAFEIPFSGPGRAWHRIVDTSLEGGEDFHGLDKAPRIVLGRYALAERASAILATRPLKT